jgi:hypothetical protein
MASSAVDVCNIALKRLGVEAIVDLTENTDRASACNAIYLDTVKRVQREHPWGCCQVRATLALLSNAPVFGYAYQFTYPTKPLCLRIVETDPPDAEWDIENTIDANGEWTGKVIVTNESSLSIRYTGLLEDVTKWDSSLVEAIASDLTEQLAGPLTESPARAEREEKKAEKRISRARTADSQEGSTKQADINVLVDIRRHGMLNDFTRNSNSI